MNLLKISLLPLSIVLGSSFLLYLILFLSSLFGVGCYGNGVELGVGFRLYIPNKFNLTLSSNSIFVEREKLWNKFVPMGDIE